MLDAIALSAVRFRRRLLCDYITSKVLLRLSVLSCGMINQLTGWRYSRSFAALATPSSLHSLKANAKLAGDSTIRGSTLCCLSQETNALRCVHATTIPHIN